MYNLSILVYQSWIQIETFLLVKAVDYCCIIYGISKPDAIHLLENSVSDDRGYI